MEKKEFKLFTDAKIRKTIKVDYISVDIFKSDVCIFKGKTQKELYTYWKNNDKECSATTKNFLQETGNVIIVFNEANPSKEDVVHELTHATQMIMHNIGHSYGDKEADEPFAYLMGFLVKSYYKINK